MRISYVTSSTEKIASFRYRIQTPSKELLRSGVVSSIGRLADAEAQIVVFSKHWTFNDASYALFCRHRGQRVLFDICDDHFGNERLRSHYLRMAEVAHLLTVNSESMHETVLRETGRESTVIPDPVLSQRLPYNPERELRGLWFGQKMNFLGLAEVYPKDCKEPLLVISPNIANPPEQLCHEEVHVMPWSPKALDDVQDKAGYALLPYRQGKDAKSANRVLEALNIGLPVLTDTIPAVALLRGHGVYDLREEGGLLKGLEMLRTLKGKDALRGEVEKAQALIDEKYSPQAVAKEWLTIFRVLA